MKRIYETTALALLLCVASLVSCTIAVIDGRITPDGRPLLWKNRDVTNPDQEFAYFSDGRYRYVANIYNGGTNKAWAGANEEGFGIINSDTYNNGTNRGTGPDDGQVMKWALQYCLTVDDFQRYLDSTNITGRATTHCYGVIDAYGNAAMFEASNNSYVRFNASDAPEGFIARANFAVSGSIDNRLGLDRYERAISRLSSTEYIDFIYLYDSLASDVGTTEINPLPFPFFGSGSTLPQGYISTYSTINRYLTKSCQIIVGKSSPSDITVYPFMWGAFGQPLLSLPFPLFPSTEGVSPLLDGASGSEICRAQLDIRATIYDTHIGHYFNTQAAKDVMDYFMPVRAGIISVVESRLRDYESTGFTYEELRAFSDSVALTVGEAYSMGLSLFVKEKPSRKPEDITISPYPNPFNGLCRLIPKGYFGYDRAIVYDNSGKMVSILHPELDGSFIFDPSGLSSGI